MVSNAEALGEKFAPPTAEDVVKATPGIGQQYTTFSDGFKLLESIQDGDAAAIAQDANTLAGDVASWGAQAASAAADPIGWLVEQGLSFLLDVIYPLKDMLELVTGDPEALSTAADTFSQLGDEMIALGDEAQQLLDEGLRTWQGDAAEAAGKRMAKFCGGIRLIADDAGNVAEILQLSSVLMQIAYDILLGIISEFVKWLILTWIPALAAAGPTFGGSTAAAGTATTVQSAQAVGEGTEAVRTGSKYLDEVQSLIGRLKGGESASKLFSEGAGEAVTKGLKGGAGIPTLSGDWGDGFRIAESVTGYAGKAMDVGEGIGRGERHEPASDEDIDESLEI